MSLGSTVEAPATTDWWRSAVVYQLYIRSFADGDGDGVGDIAGIRARLAHLRDLGVDAVWINPWYPSPMADAGYDVSDYRAIEPAFGTSAEAAALIAEAHALGPARAAGHRAQPHLRPARLVPGRAGGRRGRRARYLFRPGRGDGPPNDWQSVFGGPAWTQVADGSWYLHLFDPGQPDLDWTNPEVVAEFESVLRFWFDQGVDGFRIDVAHGLVKAEGLPDVGTPGRRGDARARPPARPPVLGPRRRARDLPRLAAGGRLLPGGEGVRRRGVGGLQRAPHPLPARRRAAHGVQLPLPQHAVGRGGAARGDRRVAVDLRDDRRARHLGAVQPRRRAARLAAGPPAGARAGTRSPRCRRSRRSTASWARGGPARPRC